MINFENLKKEINIDDFAESRIHFDDSTNTLTNDVNTYTIPSNGTDEQVEAINDKAFRDELEWLKTESEGVIK